LAEFPDVYLHTHSENLNEVEWVASLFPNSKGYLDVYDQAGLVRDKSVFAHGVQLTDVEFKRLSEANSAILPNFKPVLGKWTVKLELAKSVDHPVKVGLGTDGRWNQLSILQTANEASR